MNLLDTLALFGTVAIAAPIGLLGIEFLLEGRPVVGAGFLVIAVGLVVVGYFTPSLKGIVADTVVGTVVKEPDEDGKADEDRDDIEDGEAYKD